MPIKTADVHHSSVVCTGKQHADLGMPIKTADVHHSSAKVDCATNCSQQYEYLSSSLKH